MSGIGGIWTTLNLDQVLSFSLPEIISFTIIFGLAWAFSCMLYSWMTPPKPHWLGAVAIGLGSGSLLYWIISTHLPIASSLITAACAGVYDWQGYLWVISLILLLMVFAFNAWESWNHNQPLEMIQ